jgi:cell division protein FtsQ
MLTQRIVRRDRDVAARRGLVLGAAAGVALVVAILALGRWLPSLSLFAIDDIEVRVVPRARHLTRAGVAARSGVRAGDSLLALDLREVAGRLEADPWADAVVVRRELPSRLVLTVMERQPAAIVQLDRLYFADAAGRVFKPVDRGEAVDLPVVTGLGTADLASDPAAFASRLVTGLALLEQASRRLPAPVSEVHNDPVRGFVLRTAGDRGSADKGIELVVGEGPFGPKLDRAVRVLEHLAAAGRVAASIDLTYEHRAVARTRDAAAEQEPGGVRPSKGRHL